MGYEHCTDHVKKLVSSYSSVPTETDYENSHADGLGHGTKGPVTTETRVGQHDYFIWKFNFSH